MAQVFLTNAADALEEATRVRAEKFQTLTTESAFVIEDLNSRIAKAVSEGEFYIELTQEEITTVPNCKPELFLAYLKEQGFTLLTSKKGSVAAYFNNPLKEQEA